MAAGFANVIREIRGDETPEEFAKRIGVSRTEVYDFESKRRVPGAKVYHRISSRIPRKHREALRVAWVEATVAKGVA